MSQDHDHDPSGIDTTERLLDLVDGFRTAMLITRPGDGAPRSRPMTIASRDDHELWFVTSRETELVSELEADAGCGIAMQSDRRYVALRGLAQTQDDPDKIRELWSETMRPWFPKGPSSPEILLVRFSALEGEYWDMSGLRMVRLLFAAAKAYVQGKALEGSDPRQHAGVTL